MIKLPRIPDYLNAPWPYLPSQLRARDIEVARCALEAAAAAVSDGYLGRIDPVCAAIIRALKIEGDTT
jgi:hypothetical protein